MKDSSEILHSRHLAQGDPTAVWGWASPAGRVRAARRAQLIMATANLRPGMRVLELGCGSGIFSEYFANTGVDLVALDISAELLELTKKHGQHSKVSFLVASAEELPFGAKFDAIIGSSILHHLDMDKALDQIFDHLAPKGICCFAEPNMLNPQIFLQKNIPWLKKMLGDSPDESAFFRWPLRKMLEQKGFRDIAITPFDWLHPMVPKPCIPMVSRLGLLLENTPLLQEFAGSLLIKGRK